MRSTKWIFAVGVAMALAACGGGQDAQQVTGTLSGTGGGTVQLRLFAGDSVQDTTVTGDGSYAFPQAISGEYFILVDSDPVGLACTAFDSEGDATPRDAKSVSCARTAFEVGGTITSDPDIGDVLVELRNTVNGETLILANSGDFTFTQAVAADSNYNVVVASQTAGFACSVANGSGAATGEVANIAVTCTPESAALAPMSVAMVEGQPSTGFPPGGLKAVFDGRQFIVVTWNADSTSTYRLFEDKDGLGPGASVLINDAFTRLNGRPPIGNRDWVILVDPAQVLFTHNRARYSVQSCFNDVCSRVSEPVTIDFSQIPNMVAALDSALVAGEQFYRLRDKQLKDAVAFRDDMSYYRQDLNDRVSLLVKQRRWAQETTRSVWEARSKFPGVCSLDKCYPFLLNSI